MSTIRPGDRVNIITTGVVHAVCSDGSADEWITLENGREYDLLDPAQAIEIIEATKEPEYEPGVMYADAIGNFYLNAPQGEPRNVPWLAPGIAGRFGFHYPLRPLTRLIRGGRHD